MSTFKCKMCGGTLEIQEGQTVAECEYCGAQQTVAKSRDEVISNLFSRANSLRMKSEFDRAEQTYEKILEQDNTEAEAHWGIVLCRYGIEYVEDPKTFKRIPTCHRTSYKAVTADADYLAALEYADLSQKAIYQAEAKAIDEIQKNILAIVKNEKPFDVFICYKESDETGRRTHDSVIANDIYHQLTQEGFKVFYAAITLEDKLGQAYEPYIFAALNSAKVMLVLGTKPEYFSAVWVKNEWSRFLQLMRNDRSKLLIPCYRDMDAYDLPEEFAHLQAQDMNKIGFINDVVRGIKKVVRSEATAAPTVVKEVIKETAGNTNTAPLLKRAFLFMEDGDWASADEYCEKVLDIDPENGEAYLGKLMAELQVRKRAGLKDLPNVFDKNSNYQKAVRYGSEKEKAELQGYIAFINTRNENARLEEAYTQGKNAMRIAKNAYEYEDAAFKFQKLEDYRDAAELAQKCVELAETARKDCIYVEAKAKMGRAIDIEYNAAIALLKKIPGWRDADDLIATCNQKIDELNAKAEHARQERARISKRNKKIALIVTPIVCAVIAFIVLLNTVIIPNGKYNDAIALMEAGKYEEAISAFESLDGYKNSLAQINNCKTAIMDISYNDALALMNMGQYEEAISVLSTIKDYKDGASLQEECYLKVAKQYFLQKDYQKVCSFYEKITDYDKTVDFYIESCYYYGKELLDQKDYTNSINYLIRANTFSDATELLKEAKYQYVIDNQRNSIFVHSYLTDLVEIDYKDSKILYDKIFSWTVDIIVNSSPSDRDTSLTKISKGTPLYFHYVVSGGEPNAILSMRYTVVYGDNTSHNSSFLKSQHGYAGTISWTDGIFITGTVKIYFYDSNSNLIGQSSIEVV